MFWLGLFVGFTVGGFMGILVAAMCVAAGRGNHDDER
jgi:hypothetical protein